MDSAVIGLIGVVAGSLTTGGTQVWISSRQRHNDALAAARVVWGALHKSYSQLNDSVARGDWYLGAHSLLRHVAVWDEQKDAVARVVDAADFELLEIAFSRLALTVEQAGDFDVKGLAAVASDPTYKRDMFILERARERARLAGSSGIERLPSYSRRRERWKREAEALMPTPQGSETVQGPR